MASMCVGDCLNNKSDAPCVRPGTTYANLHKWPVAEAEFVRSISEGGGQCRTTVVDSISCRQMYLRSYTFSRKEENEHVREDLHGEHGAGRNVRDRFVRGERKKATKNNIRESRIMLHGAFVGRLVRKCLSCGFSTKVNNMLKSKVYQQRDKSSY